MWNCISWEIIKEVYLYMMINFRHLFMYKINIPMKLLTIITKKNTTLKWVLARPPQNWMIQMWKPCLKNTGSLIKLPFGATGRQSFCRRLHWGGSTSVVPPFWFLCSRSVPQLAQFLPTEKDWKIFWREIYFDQSFWRMHKWNTHLKKKKFPIYFA